MPSSVNSHTALLKRLGHHYSTGLRYVAPLPCWNAVGITPLPMGSRLPMMPIDWWLVMSSSRMAVTPQPIALTRRSVLAVMTSSRMATTNAHQHSSHTHHDLHGFLAAHRLHGSHFLVNRRPCPIGVHTIPSVCTPSVCTLSHHKPV